MKCESLDVWKRSCKISIEIYRTFFDFNDFGFKDQITRSSLSIASNIAEGIEKDSLKEKIRFIEIARGSCAELITQIHIGRAISYIDRTSAQLWIAELNEIMKMLNALKKTFHPHY